MTEVFAARRERFLSDIGLAPNQGVLITNPIDIAYLSGFTGSNGTIVLSGARHLLFTDSRYAERVHLEAPDIEVLIPASRFVGVMFETAKNDGISSLLADENHLTVAALRSYQTAADGVSIEATAFPTAKLRMTKDLDEVARVRRACEITDQALAQIIPTVHVGMTERQLALRLETLFCELGGDGRAFESIVATGSNSAIPHHSPTDRAIAQGDLLKIDFGALYRGYHADETRTFVMGEPAAWQSEIHAVVAQSQAAGRNALKAGVTLAEVDAASFEVIKDAGYAEFFTHGLGHGVGLQIHEDPFFRPNDTAILRDGYTVTIEPGIYLPGRGGVRIEDTLVVGQDSAESLTTSSRELRVIG
jgi:Xaa-Pro aminopeptidase